MDIHTKRNLELVETLRLKEELIRYYGYLITQTAMGLGY